MARFSANPTQLTVLLVEQRGRNIAMLCTTVATDGVTVR